MNPGPLHLTASAWAAVAALALVSCSTANDNDVPTAEDYPVATWRIDPASPPTSDSTEIDVLVSRLECSNGVTGAVNEPRLEKRPGQIVIAFTVEDLDLGAATCPGNPEVAASVQLDEALGDRTLVDGQCSPGLPAAETSSCRSADRWPIPPNPGLP